MADSTQRKTKSEERREQIVKVVQQHGKDGAELFHSLEDEPYARVPVNDHFENWPIDSAHFKLLLIRAFYKLAGVAPGDSQIKETRQQMKAVARFDGPARPIGLRVARYEESYYLDLCDKTWQIVEITAAGWRIVPDCPVRFRREAGMQALPEPEPGGDINELFEFINVPLREHRVLAVAWLIAALRAHGPFAILALHGPQDAGKSTTAFCFRQIIDPSSAPLQSLPRGERDLLVTASKTHIPSYDNVSKITPKMSDSFAKLAVGTGWTTRTLFTTTDQTVFPAMARPILFNGIDDTIVEREDLLDRTLMLHLPSIVENNRRTDRELKEAFAEARPRILGALLDAFVVALRNEAFVSLPSKPRMLDFATWATAAEEALGFESGEFIEAYENNRAEIRLMAIEGAPVASALVKWIRRVRIWEGTAAELLAELNRVTEDALRHDPAWPKGGRGMQAVLSRAEPNLKKSGIVIEKPQREAGTGRRLLHITLQHTTPSEVMVEEPAEVGA